MSDADKLNAAIIELLGLAGLGTTEDIWAAIQSGKSMTDYHKEHAGHTRKGK